MGVSSDQLVAFLTSAGISMPGLRILIASILISLTLIFIIIIMRGNHKSWSKEYIDFGEYSERTLGLVFIMIIVVYLVN
jgi:hypothetical protein